MGKATSTTGYAEGAHGVTCHPKELNWMYTLIVRSIITHGTVVWSRRTGLCTVKTTLDKIQRLESVCITGRMRSRPTAAVEVLVHLHLPVEEVAWETRVILEIFQGEKWFMDTLVYLVTRKRLKSKKIWL